MKILIAEDTEDSRIMLEMALAAQGYKVLSSSNGAEALELLKAEPTLPDLIVSDILMPEMDGFELCRIVKSDPKLKHIPFIFYTATYTDRRDEELGMALGATKFVVKPMEPGKFMQIIKDEIITSRQSDISSATASIQKDPNELEQMHHTAVSRKLNKKISELEDKKASLKHSEEKYQHLVETVQNYFFFYTRDVEGNFTYVSSSIEMLLGYSSDDFLVHHSKYLTKEPHNEKAWIMFKLSCEGKEQPAFEIEIANKNGKISWLEVKEFPIFDQHGNVSHVEGIAHDITMRKQTDEMLRRSQKMEALGNLTGGIVHDYNNTLGIILGYAELLEEILSKDPKLRKYIHEIHRAAERGTKLSKKLLSFTRYKEPNSESVNINTIISNEKSMLEKVLTTSLELVLKLDDDLWATWLDRNDLEDTILNITINAAHAMEPNGQLTIKTTNHQVNEIDAQQLDLDAGDYVLLSFCDTGCGIDKRLESKIFEPFYTTKGDKGTGLGLSQVYGFVERSGGSIKVYSEINHGTQFNLFFPRYLGEAINDEVIAQEYKQNLNGTESILIVDDEPTLLNLASEILSTHGYKTFCAQTGMQALEVLEKESIDLVFTDIIMPKISGYELAKKVLEKYPQIKILLTSGFTGNDKATSGNQEIDNNLLHKPYNSQKLLIEIHKLLH